MFITCDREELLARFTTTASVIPTRTSKDVFKHVLLTCDAEGSRLMASDSEVSLRMHLGKVQINVPGSVLLQADRIGPILREATDDSMVIETDGSKVLIHGERSDFELPAVSPEDFPTTMRALETADFDIAARVLSEMIRRTAFVTDPENSRYALTGALWEIEDEQLLMISTDGRRLAKMQGPVQVLKARMEHTDRMTIVPARVMHLIERLCFDQGGPVQIACENNEILLTMAGAELNARLVEGRFPKWRDVTRQASVEIQVELPVGPLLSAVRQAAIVTDKESRALDFRFVDGKLELAGWAAELGSSRIELPVAYHGTEFALALDNRFMTDFLRVLDPQSTIRFLSSGPDAPAHFRTEDGYLYVIMPMERRKPRAPAVAEASVAP